VIFFEIAGFLRGGFSRLSPSIKVVKYLAKTKTNVNFLDKFDMKAAA
jgi:hypothetical protein